MRVIFLTYDLPYPLSSGGKIRAYQMLKALSANHEITLFSYSRREPDPESLKELSQYCREIRVFRRQKVWSAAHFLRAGLSMLPGAIAHYENRELLQALREAGLSGKYQAVHFESFYTSLYLPEVKKLGITTILGNENIEYAVYRKFVAELPRRFWLLKIFLYFDVWKMRRFEEGRWRLAEVNLAVSIKEAAIIGAVNGRQCHIIPNGVDTELFSQAGIKQEGPPTIIFVGNLKYLQNDRGIKDFLKETYPLIKKAVPSLRFKIVSSHSPSWLADYRETIDLILDERTPFYQFADKAEVMINPVRIVGGTRIKLLEALAASLPVVTYRSSLEGFAELQDGRDLLVAETPAEFAAAVIRLLKEPDLRDKIRRNGRAQIEQNYTWERSLRGLRALYQERVIPRTVNKSHG